jgi:hypothetical protein
VLWFVGAINQKVPLVWHPDRPSGVRDDKPFIAAVGADDIHRWPQTVSPAAAREGDAASVA